MNLKEIKTMTHDELLAGFYWIAVRATNEVNSRRGLTKQTAKEEEWFIAEVEKRFNVSVKDRIVDR